MSELSEYVTDVNAEIAKKSIRAFGTIIIRLPNLSKTVSSQLKNFLVLQINYVTTETLKVLKNVMRKYPEFVEEFLPVVGKIGIDQIEDIEGKTAFVWIIGQFND
jgi:hypothetical protein